MHPTVARYLCLVAVLAAAPPARAQTYETLRDARNQRPWALKRAGDDAARIATAGIRLAPANLRTMADAFIDSHRADLNLAAPDAPQLGTAHQETDELGLTHIYFPLTWHDLPVIGGEVDLHMDGAGSVYQATYKVPVGMPASETPSINESDARAFAEEAARKEAPPWVGLTVPSLRLVVVPVGFILNTPDETARLTYEVTVQDDEHDGDVFGERYYVDAGSGEVLVSLSNNEYLDRRVYDCAKTPSTNSCYIDSPSVDYYPYMHGRSENAPPRGPSPVQNIGGPAPYQNNYLFYYHSTDVDSL